MPSRSSASSRRPSGSPPAGAVRARGSGHSTRAAARRRPSSITDPSRGASAVRETKTRACAPGLRRTVHSPCHRWSAQEGTSERVPAVAPRSSAATSSRHGRPRTSSAVQPSIRSASWLQDVTSPAGDSATTATPTSSGSAVRPRRDGAAGPGSGAGGCSARSSPRPASPRRVVHAPRPRQRGRDEQAPAVLGVVRGPLQRPAAGHGAGGGPPPRAAAPGRRAQGRPAPACRRG